MCVRVDDTDRVICNMTFSIRSWRWPEVNLSKWPFRIKLYLLYSSFSASWQEEHDTGKTLRRSWLKLLPIFFVRTYFFCFCSLEPTQFISGKARAHYGIPQNVLSNVLFSVAMALLVTELRASLSKNVETGQIWPLMTSDLWSLNRPKMSEQVLPKDLELNIEVRSHKPQIHHNHLKHNRVVVHRDHLIACHTFNQSQTRHHCQQTELY